MTYSDDQVLGAVITWRAGHVPGTPRRQQLMAWEILARLEDVSTDGRMDDGVLNRLKARAAVEIVPVIKRLRREWRDVLFDVDISY